MAVESCRDVNPSVVSGCDASIHASRFSDALFDHERILESFGSLKNAAKGHFENLRIEIDQIRRHSSIRKVNSVSESVESGCILQEVEPEKGTDVDKIIDSLRITLDSVYEQVDHVVYSYKASLSQLELEREYQVEVEHVVFTACTRSLKEQFEERIWDQNAQYYGNENVYWIEKINEISSLRKELDAISKSLSNPETGMLSSHSSLEINGDLSNNRRTDQLHQKVPENHVLSSAPPWEGNGTRGESVIAVPENLDPAQLTDMSKEELVNFFKVEMKKMKRNHDYKIRDMTEKYFGLKREYLKAKRSSLPSRKDTEFDVFRKKIEDAIVKLDRILVESENFPLLSNTNESLIILKDRLESFRSENHQLRDSLSHSKKEANRLSSQVSDAIVKMPQYPVSEESLLKKVENLESAVEDAHIEAAISGDVYNCFIREAISQIKWISEDSEMEHNIMKEIYDLVSHANKIEFKDSDLESIIIEGLCTIIFREAFTEAKEKVHDLSTDAFEKERVLKLKIAENAKLQQCMLSMASAVDEKEKLLNETAAAMEREKVKFMVVIHELNLKLDLAKKDLRESNDEKSRLLVAFKEKEDILSSVKANENDHRKQMKSIIILVAGLSNAIAGFERRVAEDMKRSNLRLENLSSQSSSLIEMANALKRKGLQYKQNLERRCSDLEKAETEVNLLADELEVLLGHLKKIYIALDQYSPVLKHYSGIMETLKLIRRVLSKESAE